MTHGLLNPAQQKRARNRPAMCALFPGVSEVTKSLPFVFFVFRTFLHLPLCLCIGLRMLLFLQAC